MKIFSFALFLSFLTATSGAFASEIICHKDFTDPVGYVGTPYRTIYDLDLFANEDGVLESLHVSLPHYFRENSEDKEWSSHYFQGGNFAYLKAEKDPMSSAGFKNGKQTYTIEKEGENRFHFTLFLPYSLEHMRTGRKFHAIIPGSAYEDVILDCEAKRGDPRLAPVTVHRSTETNGRWINSPERRK